METDLIMLFLLLLLLFSVPMGGGVNRKIVFNNIGESDLPVAHCYYLERNDDSRLCSVRKQERDLMPLVLLVVTSESFSLSLYLFFFDSSCLI